MSTRSPITTAAPVNFAAHLTALMRASGMTPEELAQKSGVGRAATGTALHPSHNRCISLDTAERLAIAVDGSLPGMTGPFSCTTCSGEPPAGFTCNTCGTKGGTS